MERLVIERVQAVSEPALSREGWDRPALELAYELTDAGFHLSVASGGGLDVTHLDGAVLTARQQEEVTANEHLLLAMARIVPEPAYPIGWFQEWRLELDSMLRRAASMLPGQLRDEVIGLARTRVTDQEGWRQVWRKLKELTAKIKAESPDGLSPPRAALTPYQGWLREGKGDWRMVVTATSSSEDGAWRLMVGVAGLTEHSDKCVLPAGRRPDQVQKKKGGRRDAP